MRTQIIVVLAFIIIGMVIIGYIPSQAQGQDDDWDLQELLELGAQDINDYWQQVFAENNLQYIQPEITLFTNRRIRTGCGVARSRTGPFYCPNDHTIYLPYNFMQEFLDNVGDFAVVLILAHEWGHSVQAQVGELRGLSINRELQADC